MVGEVVARKTNAILKEFMHVIESIKKDSGFKSFIELFGEYINIFLEKTVGKNIAFEDLIALLQELRANISNAIHMKKTFVEDDRNEGAIYVAEKFINALDKIICCDNFRSLFEEDSSEYEENLTFSKIIILSIKNIVDKNAK